MEIPRTHLELRQEKLKHYIYRDVKADRIIFECEAAGILEADKMYEEQTGNDPSKQTEVGCSVKDPEEDKKGE